MLIESIGLHGRFVATLLVCMGALIAWHGTPEAQDWPKKPVKIVVSSGPEAPPNSWSDRGVGTVARIGLTNDVENKPGNSGAIASGQVVRAEPDGYTLLIGGAGPHLVGPAVNPNIGYDTMRDFSHIAMIAGDSFIWQQVRC